MRAAIQFPVVIAGWFVVLLSGFHVLSAAADEQKEQEAVTFSIPQVWPWAYEDDNGNVRGSLVAVADQLSAKTGIPVITRLRPLRRAIVELRNGDVNFSILFRNPELDAEAINVSAVTQVSVLLAAMAGTDYPLSLDKLRGKRVAYIRGTYLGEAFEKSTTVEKVPVHAISQAVELLSLGRIEAILGSDHNIYRTLSSLNMSRDELRYHEHVPGLEGTIYMSRAARRPEAARRFSAAIEQMEADGELQQIFYGRAASTFTLKTLLSAQ